MFFRSHRSVCLSAGGTPAEAETPKRASTATEAMPETLDAAELKRRGEAGEFPGCVIDGPLSFDLAYALDAAAAKRVSSSVAGAADV